MSKRMPLWLLTKKNIKLLIRAKSSALIIIFAPLLLMLVLGLSFNSGSTYGIQVGIYSTSLTEDVVNFAELLKQESFTVHNYNQLEQCTSDIKSGTIHTCINLPESFSVNTNEQKEVVFYVDPARINLVWMIQETVKEKFNIRAQEISQDLTQNILVKLSDTKKVVDESTSSISSAVSKTSDAGKKAETAKSGLRSLDFKTNEIEVDTKGLSSLDQEVIASNDLIKEARLLVKNTSLDNTTKTNILTKLNGARSKLNEAERILGLNNSEGNAISLLQNELTATQEKLKVAASKVGSSTENLDTVAITLKETSTALESVSTKLEELKKSVDSLAVTEAGTISAPIVTRVEQVGEEGTFLNYLFSALIVLVIMFSSLLLGTSLVMMERHSPAFLRNYFVPVRKITFITSIYLTNLFLNVIQILVILGISVIFLKQVVPNLHFIALALLVAASVFTFIGMVIGYIFNTEETSVLASISMGSLFLLFSGIILPLESTSSFIRGIAAFNPFVITEKIVREIFLFNTPVAELTTELGILIVYAITLFAIIWFIESIFHQHTIHKYLRHHHRAHIQNEKKNKNEA